jgi:hypothetical protein
MTVSILKEHKILRRPAKKQKRLQRGKRHGCVNQLQIQSSQHRERRDFPIVLPGNFLERIDRSGWEAIVMGNGSHRERPGGTPLRPGALCRERGHLARNGRLARAGVP